MRGRSKEPCKSCWLIMTAEPFSMQAAQTFLGLSREIYLIEYPEALVNIKTIAGLDRIAESKGTLRIGALASFRPL